MKFKVYVMRKSYAFRTFELEAESEAEATATVLDQCGDVEYNEKDAEYEIQDVEQLA